MLSTLSAACKAARRRELMGVVDMALVTRRGALTIAAGSAVALALVPTIEGSEQARADSRLPVRSDFAGHIGTTFTAADDAGSHALVLASVDDLAHATAGDENSFSLIFSTSAPLPSSTYLLTAPAVADAVLFISPIAADRAQVVVNRSA
jgi:hypothetical protein